MTNNQTIAKTMSCPTHVAEGVVHYRALYDEFECHTYRERVLFTHTLESNVHQGTDCEDNADRTEGNQWSCRLCGKSWEAMGSGSR